MTREEAIEKVRKWNLPKETREILEALAPELKESEDERIMKGILHFLKAKLENCTAPTPAKSTLSMWIDYLEKQKDAFENGRQLGIMQEQARQELEWPDEKQKDKMTAEEFESSELFQLKLKTKYADGYQDGLAQKEQKPEEWNYPYGVNETVDKLIAIAECLEMDGECLFNDYTGTECGKFLRELARKQVECKPEEWSEEDERNRNRALFYTRHYQRNSGVTDGSKECVDWLKALSLNRKKTNEDVAKLCSNEWSEEDERIRQGLIEMYKNEQLVSIPIGVHSKDIIRFLENLRPSWKPSEREKGALRTAIHILTDERSFPKAAAQLQNILDAFE